MVFNKKYFILLMIGFIFLFTGGLMIVFAALQKNMTWMYIGMTSLGVGGLLDCVIALILLRRFLEKYGR